MADMNSNSFRKISPGLTRATGSCMLKARGFRLAGSPGAGVLTVQLPPALTRLLGWHVGLSLKVRATERGVTLSVRRVPSALHSVPPRKRRAADQVRFQRRWQQALRTLQRDPQRHRWTTGKKRKAFL